MVFIIKFGKYSSCRLNFGFKIRPAQFAELMDKVLGHFPKYKIGYFIDDVTLAANTTQEILQLLQEVLEMLIAYSLTIESSNL